MYEIHRYRDVQCARDREVERRRGGVRETNKRGAALEGNKTETGCCSEGVKILGGV